MDYSRCTLEDLRHFASEAMDYAGTFLIPTNNLTREQCLNHIEYAQEVLKDMES